MKYYHVDSFTNELFKGNPAGVCILGEQWLDDSVMQNIAAENCLAETAFVICQAGNYHIRWFAPKSEIYLCGHATLAAAYVLFFQEGFLGQRIAFKANIGDLAVAKEGDTLTLDFPLCHLAPVEYKGAFDKCFDKKPKEVYKANEDYLFVFQEEKDIRDIRFDLPKIAELQEVEGIIVTAKGEDCDFVSRCFAPQVGIDEDPVTGSAHTGLCAYWMERLGKDQFFARQLSPRGGSLQCKVAGERVYISGQVVLYMKGEIYL